MHFYHGMLQRCRDHNYRSRCIYMVTDTTVDRAPLLGELAGVADHPFVESSRYGRIVERCWQDIPARFPGVSLFDCQIMPDHFHGIIFVEREMEKPLGSTIGYFKAHSTSLIKQLLAQPPSTQPASGLQPNRASAQATKRTSPGDAPGHSRQ